MNSNRKKIKIKKILMITAGLAGGSFIALKHLAQVEKPDHQFLILGLGKYAPKKTEPFKVISIPYFRYDGYWGHIAAKYTWLGLIFQIPLYIVSLFYIITLRPDVVVFNGLATAIPLLPFAHLVGSKVVV